MSTIRTETGTVFQLGAAKTIAFGGTFDLFSSARVLEAIRDDKGSVEIDLHHVSLYRDAALRVLAEALAAAGPGRVIVRGLGEHQRKILNYLGIHAESYEPRVEESPIVGRDAGRSLNA